MGQTRNSWHVEALYLPVSAERRRAITALAAQVAHAASFSGLTDGTQAASLSADGNIALISSPSGSLRITFESPQVTQLGSADFYASGVSADGKMITGLYGLNNDQGFQHGTYGLLDRNNGLGGLTLLEHSLFRATQSTPLSSLRGRDL